MRIMLVRFQPENREQAETQIRCLDNVLRTLSGTRAEAVAAGDDRSRRGIMAACDQVLDLRLEYMAARDSFPPPLPIAS